MSIFLNPIITGIGVIDDFLNTLIKVVDDKNNYDEIKNEKIEEGENKCQ